MTNKEKTIDPIKLLKADIKQGKTKREAFRRYLSEHGEPIRGSMTLAMIPDPSDQKKYRWLKIFMLAMYWVPILGLYIASAVQGNYSVFLSHFFWPTLVTVFIVRNSTVSYYFFLYIVAHELYVAFNSNIDHVLFLPITFLYGFALLALTVFTKMRMYPYQSFFHQNKNADKTFVFTSEPDVTDKKPMPKKRRR